MSSLWEEGATRPSEFLTVGGDGVYTERSFFICFHLSAGPREDSSCRFF